MKTLPLILLTLVLAVPAAQAQTPWPPGPPAFGPYPAPLSGAPAPRGQCAVRCQGNVAMFCCRNANGISCKVRGPCTGGPRAAPAPPPPPPFWD